MLPKGTDWKILAQCDGQAVRLLVEYGTRSAETIVRLKPIEQFNKLCDTSLVMKKCFELCLKSYEDLRGYFEVRHDQYDGYRLLYVGVGSIPAFTVFKSTVKGYLVDIPEGISDLSIVTRTKGRSKKKIQLMLGPIRFVNSDCDPNCEYDFSSCHKIVRLRSLKTLKTGEEVTVKYGDEYFDKAECRCLTCGSASVDSVVIPREINIELPNSPQVETTLIPETEDRQNSNGNTSTPRGFNSRKMNSSKSVRQHAKILSFLETVEFGLAQSTVSLEDADIPNDASFTSEMCLQSTESSYRETNDCNIVTGDILETPSPEISDVEEDFVSPPSLEMTCPISSINEQNEKGWDVESFLNGISYFF